MARRLVRRRRARPRAARPQPALPTARQGMRLEIASSKTSSENTLRSPPSWRAVSEGLVRLIRPQMRARVGGALESRCVRSGAAVGPGPAEDNRAAAACDHDAVAIR